MDKLPLKKMPMVRWFDPGQLINTAIRAIISTFIGEQSDRRIIQALTASKEHYFDFSGILGGTGASETVQSDRDEIWIDYIADTGDGWNSTYGIAYNACREELELSTSNGNFCTTRRGEILIFGGDEVYPTPSKKAYYERLVVPFENAIGDADDPRDLHVFAIPGNHDWYDGLSAFSKLFCSDLNPKFAKWHSRQRRSYFALKLPGKWWLLGSDGQLQSDIDTPQLEYFRSICNNHMEEGDKVIICISQPNWIYAHKYKKYGEDYDESDLIYLQKEILGNKNVEIKVYLSGDYHHYRRHQEIRQDSETPVQKITAGGGGAFLHPTHDIDVSVITEDYGFKSKSGRSFELKKSYPDTKMSRALTFRNLLFPFLNPAFGVLTAVIYLFTAWLVASSINFKEPSDILEAFKFTAEAFFVNPLTGVWLLILIGSFIFFTDTHSRLYKWSGGFLHAISHIVAIFLLSWAAVYVGSFILNFDRYLFYLFLLTFLFFGGWFAGSVIFGVYLFISQYFFCRHSEESFSASRIQDFKNFLRLHIKKDGSLTIFPVKLERVPRKWKARASEDNENAFVVPLSENDPELIEDPVVLKYRTLE